MTTDNLQGRNWTVYVGDVLDSLRAMPDRSVHCCVTSPPYFGLRDYGVAGQIGLESTPEAFVSKMVEVFREVRRVLRDDGTCWVNMGDSYAANGQHEAGFNELRKKFTTNSPPPPQGRARTPPGLKPKDLCGIPWRLAFALQADGWYLRQDIIWHKKAPMPESVNDRCTKAHEYIFKMSKSDGYFECGEIADHEYLFLMSKQSRYFYDQEATKEQCSNSTHARLSQDVAKQVGSDRANGGKKTNGKMKAVCSGSTRKLAESGSGTKNNGSFDTAMAIMPPARNLRSVWSLSPEPFSEAHFATFPSELPRRCIKAGTSEKGCCSECGSPWVRVTEKKAMVIKRSERTHEKGRTRSSGTVVEPASTKTTGWQASCDCGAEIAPCVVLDPFSGSGTTGMVATEMGRKYIGCELNPAYAAMSAKRIESWKHRDTDKPVESLPGQKELF